MNDHKTIPICLAPQGDVPPHAYVIQLEAQVCTSCNTRKTHCQIFSKTHLKSRWDRKYVTNLRPVRGPQDIQYNLPIEPLMRPDVIVPFCDECFDRVNLTHLPSPPPPPAQQLNLDKKSAPSIGASADAKPKNRKPTIDDLLDI